MPGPLSEKGIPGLETYSRCEHDRRCSSADTEAVRCLGMAKLATESGAPPLPTHEWLKNPKISSVALICCVVSPTDFFGLAPGQE